MSGFHNPVRVRFGADALGSLPTAVAGRRCVVITTAGMAARGTLGLLESALGGLVLGAYTEVEANPTVASCTRAYEAIAALEPELLVALGGGSALDTTKAVAAQLAHRGSPTWLSDHLRGGTPLTDAFAPLPIVAIPTTAGTGSEVTMWATIWDEETAGKHSLSHPALYAEWALLDPSLTMSLPASTTAASALDALSHAMESIWNRGANPVSDAVATAAIRTIPAALRRALAAPDDLRAREALLSASLLAGLAISSTRTALAHSISYPLTAELGLTHGIACSVTLPALLVEVTRARPDRGSLIVDALGAGSAEAAAESVRSLLIDAGAPAVVRAHVPGATAIDGLKGTFIAPGRAENFVLDVDEDWAVGLLHRSLDRLA